MQHALFTACFALQVFSVSNSGVLNWKTSGGGGSFTTWSPVLTSATPTHDKLLIFELPSSSYPTTLSVIRASDGSYVRSIGRLPGDSTSGPPSLGADGRLYLTSLTSASGYVLSVDLDTGDTAWRMTTYVQSAAYGSPAIGPDGTVYGEHQLQGLQ